MGGLSKKASKIEELRQQSSAASLTVDAGDLFFSQYRVTPFKEGQDKASAVGLVDGYNIIGYDAVAVGMRDLSAGLDFLLQLKERATFPLLSANLIRKSTGKPIFLPSVLIERNGLKVAITAITDRRDKTAQEITDDADTDILPWNEVLPQLTAELAGQSDFVILLSNLSLEENVRIAAELPAIQLIVQSGYRSNNLHPQKHNNSLICQTGHEGKHLGELNLSLRPGKIWQESSEELLVARQQELDRCEWQLKAMRRKGDPEIVFQGKPSTIRAYKALMVKQEQLSEELKSLQAVVAEEKKIGPTGSTYGNTFHDIEITLPDHPEVLKITENVRRTVNNLGRQRSRQQVKIMTYTGWLACADCHAEQTDKWKMSPHAATYRTLENKLQQYDLNCIPCHVTAVTTGSEPFALSLPDEFLAVGCEACHGGGEKHAASPNMVKVVGKPAQEVCLRCHTPEQDDDFDYERDLKKLGCK